MKQILLGYDPSLDLKEVDQFGYVDLHDALVNKAIPADLQAQQVKFNNVDDPNQVRPRPSDVFESIQASRVYADVVEKESASHKTE